MKNRFRNLGIIAIALVLCIGLAVGGFIVTSGDDGESGGKATVLTPPANAQSDGENITRDLVDNEITYDDVKSGEQAIVLTPPSNLYVDGEILTWDLVENASGYVVKIGETEKEISSNRCNLKAEFPRILFGSYDVFVKAKGDGSIYKNSDYLNSVVYEADNKTYRAIVNQTDKTNMIISSYSDGEHNFYLIDAGYVEKTLIAELGTVPYNGMSPMTLTVSDTTTESVTETLRTTISESLETSAEFSIGASISSAINAAVDIGLAKGSTSLTTNIEAKLTLGIKFNLSRSNTTEIEKINSVSSTITSTIVVNA